MLRTRASKTASWVAAARTFGAWLPADCQLCRDPYGVRFSAPWLQALARASAKRPALARQLVLRAGAATRLLLYMQLRTRFIDDALLAFAARGGRQIVLLGAGYDCRAWRLGPELPGTIFYEVDHPATQAVKRQVLEDELSTSGGSARSVRFVPWDFERDPMSALPEALGRMGHDRTLPTLTIWEGVTMYLGPPAIEASFAAIRSYSPPVGSKLVFTYFDRKRIEQPSRRARALSAFVASVGEPFRFGWSPAELPAWLPPRGFELGETVAEGELGERLLPPEHRHRVRREGRNFAVATRTAPRDG